MTVQLFMMSPVILKRATVQMIMRIRDGEQCRKGKKL